MKNHSSDSGAAAAQLQSLAQLVLQNLPEATLLVDVFLRIQDFNKKAAGEVRQRMNLEIVPGMSVFDLMPPSRHEALRQLYSDVLKGFTRTSETSFPDPEHGTVFFENHFLPARSEDGAVVGALLSAKDITLRKKAEQALKEAEERWQFAFEASNQAAWDWNMQTDEVIYSASYKKMYGFAEGELTGRLSEWQSRIHPDDRKKLEDAIARHSQAEDPFYETTYRIQLRNGDYKWILARGKVVSKDAEGRPLRMIGTHTDLTQTMKTKEEIRRSNERFHYAAKASSQALWDWNAETGAAYVSPSFTQLFGWKPGADGRFEQWHQLIHPEDRNETINGYYQSLQDPSKEIWQAEYRLLKADGTYALVSDKACVLRNEEGKATRVIGATEDVTALKRTEEELRRSNERYDIMLMATNELLYEWDMRTGDVFRSKEGIRNVYGIADEAALQTLGGWESRIHPEDREKVAAATRKVLAGGHLQTFEIEYRIRNDAGTYNDVYGRGILLRDEAGAALRMIGSEQNITERKRLERELLQSELETKKRINQASVDSQEQERSQIGRELHDNINQVLTTTKLYLELGLADRNLAAEMLQRASDNVNQVINEIRQLSRSLMDPTLGNLGLLETIRNLVENLNLTRKVNIQLEANETIERLLEQKRKLAVFRILQEALNNVLRHANASNVVVRLYCEKNNVVLCIHGDGAGFAMEAVKRGAGLKNITNRVYLVNGQLAVETRPGRGCKITINFPIHKTDQP